MSFSTHHMSRSPRRWCQTTRRQSSRCTPSSCLWATQWSPVPTIWAEHSPSSQNVYVSVEGRTGWVNERRTEGQNEGLADGRTDGRTDGQTDGRTTDGCTNGRMDRQMDWRMDGRTDSRTVGRTDRWLNGQTYERTNEWMDGERTNR